MKARTILGLTSLLCTTLQACNSRADAVKTETAAKRCTSDSLSVAIQNDLHDLQARSDSIQSAAVRWAAERDSTGFESELDAKMAAAILNNFVSDPKERARIAKDWKERYDVAVTNAETARRLSLSLRDSVSFLSILHKVARAKASAAAYWDSSVNTRSVKDSLRYATLAFVAESEATAFARSRSDVESEYASRFAMLHAQLRGECRFQPPTIEVNHARPTETDRSRQAVLAGTVTGEADKTSENVVAATAKFFPNANWNSASLIRADFSCRGRQEPAIMGNSKADIWIAVFLNGLAQKPEVLQYSAAARNAATATIEVESLDYDPAGMIGWEPRGFRRSTSCKGIRLSDGEVDAAHIFWNHLDNEFDDWVP